MNSDERPKSSPSSSNMIKGLDDDESSHIAHNQLSTTDGEPITLDVGGITYKTSLNTLSKYPKSVLFKMFEGKFSLKPNQNGAYFIDRDGTHFHFILNYLRNGTLHLPQSHKQNLIHNLLMEADFYQLPSLQKLLLYQQLSSKLLSPNDVEQIKKWITQQNKHINTHKWTPLKPTQNGVYEGSDMNGIDSLLFIFDVHNKRFGWYLESIYGESEEHPIIQDHIEEQLEYDEYLESEFYEEEYGGFWPYDDEMNDDEEQRHSDGFVFFLGNTIENNDKDNDSICCKKYECSFDGHICEYPQGIVKLENQKDELRVSFKMNKRHQDITTDFRTVLNLRNYDPFQEDAFARKEERIKTLEIYHIG